LRKRKREGRTTGSSRFSIPLRGYWRIRKDPETSFMTVFATSHATPPFPSSVPYRHLL
jgi:hypothetical protein